MWGRLRTCAAVESRLLSLANARGTLWVGPIDNRPQLVKLPHRVFASVAEIEIVSEDDQPVGTGVIHDLGVWRGGLADVGPVNAVESRIGQELDPQRAQVHVDQDSHVVGSGTSISSDRKNTRLNSS